MRKLPLALLTAAAVGAQAQPAVQHNEAGTDLEQAKTAYNKLGETEFGNALLSAFFPLVAKAAVTEPVPDFMFSQYAQYMKGVTATHVTNVNNFTRLYGDKKPADIRDEKSCLKLVTDFNTLATLEDLVMAYERRVRFASTQARESHPHSYRTIVDYTNTRTITKSMINLIERGCLS